MIANLPLNYLPLDLTLKNMKKQKQLPKGMPLQSIQRAYIKEIERHSNELISEIKSFLSKTADSDFKSAHIEIFPDEYGEGCTSIGLYLFSNVSKHIPLAQYLNDLPIIDIDDDPEENIPGLIVDIVKQWFAECWWKAGGWDFPIPVVLSGHEGFGNGELIQLTSCTPKV
jgi:hypothetical protein